MTGPEAHVERYLTKQVQERGGWCLKFAPIRAGNPDRIVLLPHLPLMLVETKAPAGRLRPAQVVWHQRARDRGHRVWVLPSRAAVDEWLSWVDKQLRDMV